MSLLRIIIEITNIALANEYHQPETSKGEFLKWLGIRLVGVLERNRGSFRDNWSESVDKDIPLRPGE